MRQGFVQTYIMPFLGYYPWRCAVCSKTFYASERSAPTAPIGGD